LRHDCSRDLLYKPTTTSTIQVSSLSHRKATSRYFCLSERFFHRRKATPKHLHAYEMCIRNYAVYIWCRRQGHPDGHREDYISTMNASAPHRTLISSVRKMPSATLLLSSLSGDLVPHVVGTTVITWMRMRATNFGHGSYVEIGRGAGCTELIECWEVVCVALGL
jgi:hypothetical protein